MENQAPFSPIAFVGTITLLLAYLVAAWCVAAGIAGNAHKYRRLVTSSVYGLYGFGALIGLSAALMIYGFVTHDFTIKYVAHTSDVTMSTWYKVTAFWGGLDGSLLFWVLVLALFSTIAIAINARKHRDMIGFVVGTIMIVQLFFLSLLIFTKNPFATYLTSSAVPADGQGLNPLLQNYWMVIHPPSLYVGFVAATIPFAFAIGALASGRLDDLWLGSVRVWMLICFGFLSLGLILGGRWAYEELGWGGYWAWDPVENAGFMPWFCATAFLHSAIIQEQRGMMKMWNMLLVILCFFLTIFGTFMTRSGAVQSVHAFGEDNVLALQFIVFMGVILVVSLGLLVYRANKLTSTTEFESFFSREFAFLLNNWILLACAFFVLFATMFPTISEALDGSRVSVGIEFFNKWMTPLGLILVFLAGAAPLLAWRKTTSERLFNQFIAPLITMAITVIALLIIFPQVKVRTSIFADTVSLPMSLVNFGIVAFGVASIVQEFYRGTVVRRRQTGSDPFTAMIGLMVSKRRKYGGYIIHLGVMVMFVGFAGKAYDRQIDRTISKPAFAIGLDAEKPPIDRAKWAKRYLDLDAAHERLLDDKLAAYDKAIREKNLAGVEALNKELNRVVTKDFAQGATMKELPVGSPATFQFGEYTFLYETLIQSSDDNKDMVTAQFSIWRDGDNVGTVYPAKWDYRKGSEATTEVAIRTRLEMGPGDVYSVLTGYDRQSELANFRVFLNPLISWVWIGFLVLAIGTLICLIPQFVVDSLTRSDTRNAKQIGRAGQITILALVVGLTAVLGGGTAQAAGGGGEHVPVGMGMGDDGHGYAAENRPNSPTAERAMNEILCVCGCPRESIFSCKCATASRLRAHVMELLDQRDGAGKPLFDLSSDTGREKAYTAVLDAFVAEYGGEQVLATPRSKFSWLLPSLAVVGGLGLLVVVGRRWISRGTATNVQATPPPTAVEDVAYADKLDDELADSD